MSRHRQTAVVRFALAAVFAVAGPACTVPAGAVPSSALTSAGGSPAADCGSWHLSAESGVSTVADLVERNERFAAGTVTALEPAIFNTLDGRKPAGWASITPDRQRNGKIYTPVDVAFDQQLTEAALAAHSGRVLVVGGTVGCYSMQLDVSPRVAVGSRYVFVLVPALDADGAPLGSSLEAAFAWPVDASDTVQTIEGPMRLATLRAKVSGSSAPTTAP